MISWIKKWGGWILGALVLGLSVAFAVKYERDKIKALKIRARVAETKTEIGELSVEQAKKEGAEVVYSKMDSDQTAVVEAFKNEAADSDSKRREEIAGMSAEELADAINLRR